MSRVNSNFENWEFGVWECKICGCKYQTKGPNNPVQPPEFCEVACKQYANSNKSWKKHKWRFLKGISYEEYRALGGWGSINRPDDFEAAGGCSHYSTVSGMKSSAATSVVKDIQKEEEKVFAQEDKEGKFSVKHLSRNKKNNNGVGCLIVLVVVVWGIISISHVLSNKTVSNSAQMTSHSSVQNSLSGKTVSESAARAFINSIYSCTDYKPVKSSGVNKVEISDINSEAITLVFNGEKQTLPYDSRRGVPYGMYIFQTSSGNGFYIKPTFAGYEVYSYRNSRDISENNMVKQASYACGIFYDNKRFPFLVRENVNHDFTNLYDKLDLKLIRNSIFAAHGYIFKSQDMVDFFKKYHWYIPSNNDLSNYTTTEKDNAKFIKIVEDNRKY